jgi:hypothetical protein
MPFIGNKPSAVPLTSADIADSIITSAKITDATIVNSDISTTAAIATTKLGAGAIRQVSQQVYSTFAQTNSQTYTDSGLTLAITPTSSSSKILVIVSMQFSTNTASSQNISCDLLRSGSSIRTFEQVLGQAAVTGTQISFTYLDSPSTTSSTTYKVQIKGSAGTGQYIRINNYLSSDGNAASTITLMEIAA